MTAAEFHDGEMLGVRASHVGPLRGVAEFSRADDGSRTTHVTLDESIETLELRAERIQRLDERAAAVDRGGRRDA